MDTREQPHEARYLKLDCAKARAELGFVPQLDLSTALAWVVEWFRAHHEGDKDMRQVTEGQIVRYESAGQNDDLH